MFKNMISQKAGFASMFQTKRHLNCWSFRLGYCEVTDLQRNTALVKICTWEQIKCNNRTIATEKLKCNSKSQK
jgi:hypothetical protein